MMIDDALGVAGGAGGIEQGNRLPFVLGLSPVIGGIALREEGFIVEIADQLAPFRQRVIDVDDQDLPFAPCPRMKAMVAASSRMFSEFRTPPSIGTP
jgi:hypothetical protein